MKLREYIKTMEAEDRGRLQAYADRVPTTVGYLRVHVSSARKPASLKFMRALARASEGNVSLLEVLQHYGVSKKELEVA